MDQSRFGYYNEFITQQSISIVDDIFTDFIEFNKKWFELSQKYTNLVIFPPGIGMGCFPNMKFWLNNYDFKWVSPWSKRNCTSRSSLGGFTHWEPILIWGKPGEKIPTDIYDEPLRLNLDQKMAKEGHPTPKAVGLISLVLKDYKPDTVLDLFGGSGSTLIACEQLNRKCYMMELDPIYCSVIIERWEKLTNKKSTKVDK